VTTIAASAKHGSMAADSKCIFGDTHFQCDKIYRLPDGSLLGTAGSDAYTRPFVDQMLLGEVPALRAPQESTDQPEPEFAALHLTDEGLFVYDDVYSKIKVNSGYYAIGSGGMPALSHMMDGDLPEVAVTKACRVDNNSGLPVLTETLKGKR